jgi:hypothetical protein
MDNIINFPTNTVRDWVAMERALNEALQNAQFSSTTRARIIEKMKSFYDVLEPDINFSITTPFPPGVSKDQVDAICSDLSKQARTIMSERLQAFTKRLFIG